MKIGLEQCKKDLMVKNRELLVMSMQLSSLHNKLDGLIKELNSISTNHIAIKSIERFKRGIALESMSWDKFNFYFKNIHPDFFDCVCKENKNLSKNDLKIFAFVKMNLNNKEMAEIMNVTFDTVSQSKRRLKKKIGLKPKDSLEAYVRSMVATNR